MAYIHYQDRWRKYLPEEEQPPSRQFITQSPQWKSSYPDWRPSYSASRYSPSRSSPGCHAYGSPCYEAKWSGLSYPSSPRPSPGYHTSGSPYYQAPESIPGDRLSKSNPPYQVGGSSLGHQPFRLSPSEHAHATHPSRCTGNHEPGSSHNCYVSSFPSAGYPATGSSRLSYPAPVPSPRYQAASPSNYYHTGPVYQSTYPQYQSSPSWGPSDYKTLPVSGYQASGPSHVDQLRSSSPAYPTSSWSPAYQTNGRSPGYESAAPRYDDGLSSYGNHVYSSSPTYTESTSKTRYNVPSPSVREHVYQSPGYEKTSSSSYQAPLPSNLENDTRSSSGYQSTAPSNVHQLTSQTATPSHAAVPRELPAERESAAPRNARAPGEESAPGNDEESSRSTTTRTTITTHRYYTTSVEGLADHYTPDSRSSTTTTSTNENRFYPTNNMTYNPSGGSGTVSRRRPAARRPRPKPEDKPQPGEVLEVKRVDLRRAFNRKQHHTKQYEGNEMIVRRGQRFDIAVEFDREFDADRDEITFIWEFGDDPRPSKNTMQSVKIQKDKLNPKEWLVRRLGDPDGRTEHAFRVMSAADAVVGRWQLTILTRDKNTKKTDEYDVPEPITIIFNPWCWADQCFLGLEDDDSDDGWGSDGGSETDNSSGSDNDDDDEDAGPGKRKAHLAKLREYVLNDTGYVWRGSYSRFSGKPWAFGQFEEPCLDAALYLLDLSGIREGARSNPTLVARTLSALANSSDKTGVLTGNWSGDYSGGAKPTSWSSSQAILEQFMQSKSPVKYGQCWVFSCLLTTLCRALGLPTRTVTNFASAHDTDNSMTIDKHIDEEGNKLKNYDDSIWNFHVWNEIWLARPDLPEGYDGWQAFDSTPQEASEGVMQCGPAPMKAIRNGEVYMNYDTKFIYGEVNGDEILWVVDSDMHITPQKVDKKKVGKNISTKIVGKVKKKRWEYLSASEIARKSRKDVTHLYKHPEGSAEEREANEKALMHSTRKGAIDGLPDAGDVTFDFTPDASTNGDMSTHLFITNQSSEERTVSLKVSIHAMYYTGVAGDEIKADEATITVAAGEQKEHVTHITTQEYISKMDADCSVDFYCRAKVQETGQRYVSDDVMIEVEKPDIILKPSTVSPKVGESFTVDIKFTNPLNVPMTNLTLQIEGPGITKTKKVPLSSYGRKLDPDQTLEVSTTLKPRSKGKHELMASLSSNQLTNIDGECMLNIRKA